MRPEPVVFIDPGPRLVQFLAEVGERLAPDYRPVFFSCHVKGRSLLRRLGQEVHPRRRTGRADGWSARIRLDPERLLGQLRRDSDRDRVCRRTPDFCWLVGELDGLLDAVQPAALFFWNGSGLAASVAEQLARPRGIPILFGENGYLPNTLQLDAEGVNAFSSIGRGISLEEIRSRSYSDAERHELEALIQAYRRGQLPRVVPPARGRVRPSLLAYLVQAWEDWRERDPPIRANRLIAKECSVLPERFVFFPLQVASDSQLTIHSPLYGNRLDLAIADLDRAVREVDPGLGLVVKLHPADVKKTDYDPVVRALPGLVWVRGGDVRAILRHAECLVTVNSTVGIEGMIFGKPVITLGNNFYSREGLVHPVRERSELAIRLAQALRQPPNADLIQQYLRYLYFVAFVRGHWRDHSPASVGNLAERMITMIRHARRTSAGRWGGDRAMNRVRRKTPIEVVTGNSRVHHQPG